MANIFQSITAFWHLAACLGIVAASLIVVAVAAVLIGNELWKRVL